MVVQIMMTVLLEHIYFYILPKHFLSCLHYALAIYYANIISGSLLTADFQEPVLTIAILCCRPLEG